MELQVEEMDGVRRKLKIKVPEEVVSQKIKSAYRELNQQIKMPGFRSGKIPQHLLEQQVPVQAMTEMWQALMQEYYDKALGESGIVPAGPPEIDHSGIKEIAKDKPFTFSVTLDIKPTIKFKNYKGLKFEKTMHQITEAEIDATIQKLMESFGSFEICVDDHKVERGDHLILDFDGTLNGGPLEGGTAKDYPMKVGEKKMIAGFEDQLIGQQKGPEFDVQVTLPLDWNKKLRRVSMPIPGAKTDAPADDLAEFKVRIKEIKILKTPELTEDFVQQQGEESVEAFRRKVKMDLQAQKKQAEEIEIKQKIFNYLVKEHDMVVPESLVKQELKFMIEGMKFQISKSGMSLEDSGFEEEVAEKEWRERAEFNTKGYVILEAIAKTEKIHVAQSELEEEFQRLAQETGKSPEDVKKALFNNPDNMSQTTSRLLGQKALNFIYSHCEFDFVKEEDKKIKDSKDEAQG